MFSIFILKAEPMDSIIIGTKDFKSFQSLGNATKFLRTLFPLIFFCS
jgi:hypothetical protein